MAEKASLQGSLGFISLADIFQILGGNASTGILEMITLMPHTPVGSFFQAATPSTPHVVPERGRGDLCPLRLGRGEV